MDTESKRPVALTRSRNFTSLSGLSTHNLNLTPNSSSSSSTSSLASLSASLTNQNQYPNNNSDNDQRYEDINENRDNQKDVQQPNVSKINLTSIVECQEQAVTVKEEFRNKIELLRDLLRLERHKNDVRGDNNRSLQLYIRKLQSDYLQLQQELVEALELGTKIKDKKDSQLANVQETINEKDKLVGKLREQIAALDERRLREEFNELSEKQRQVHQVEVDTIKKQLEALERQLVSERIHNSQILQEFHLKLDEKALQADNEASKLRNSLENAERELNRLLNEPANLVIKSLREENNKLDVQLEELRLLVSDAQAKYETMRRRLEHLVVENEANEERNFEELEILQKQYAEQRKQLNLIYLQLQDKEEMIQVTQFAFNRSEKKAKNLLLALKGKEETYEALVAKIRLDQTQELETVKVELSLLQRQLIEANAHLEEKQNEIFKLQLEQENQLQFIKSDRDERIKVLANENRLIQDKLQQKELLLDKQCVESAASCEKMVKLGRELEVLKLRNQQLSIELAKNQAKLNSRVDEVQLLSKSLTKLDEESSQNVNAKHELDCARARERRLVQALDQVRRENEKLVVKLKLNETNLYKLNESLGKEQEKLLEDYDRKLDLIKKQTLSYDKSRIKYRRYGCKLKKYFEHLKQVHQHICSPTRCGYLICKTSEDQ